MTQKKEPQLMQDITSLSKRRGFVFLSSEIYGGLGSVWDYGPLGVEMKNNIKQAWWKRNVYQRYDMEGLDCSILMHSDVWKASGHVGNFADLMVDCKECKKRHRQDHLKENKCPDCGGALTEPREFNLMFKTQIGSMEDSSAEIFLRPETAQGIFVNFKNVLNTSRKKIPFGIAQIGKSFRNEVTAGNFVFRCREFEQMEIEFFCRGEEADKWYKYWVNERLQWYKDMGIDPLNLKIREHAKDELAHYASGCSDIEYNFPFGWSELEGIANRGDYDLKQHAEFSKQDLTYFDTKTNERFLPFVVEPSGGVDRAFLAFLVDAYRIEELENGPRTVLGLHKDIAPIKTAVLPLLKKNTEIVEIAKKLRDDLSYDRRTVYDDTAAIGKLYRRQDEIGTLYCVTVDVDSLTDRQVTVRERDSMLQERISIDRLKEYLREKFNS
ncbi:MAG: glycine--tRNA ligase [Candidatus Omnitrophica bacterium]|nr:glycine--tRNA ligase [Candidatus Omnitrophota bacterium]